MPKVEKGFNGMLLVQEAGRGQSDPLDLFVMARRKRILAAAENSARLIDENQDLTKEGIFGE
jgi:hypothetical protein